MKKNGGLFEKVALKYFAPGYRGIIATQNIAKEETVMLVPRANIITLAMARNGAIGSKLVKQSAELIYPNNSFLSTFVLEESTKAGSVWSLLWEGFPKSVSNFPIFYTSAERALLAGSKFVGIAKAAKSRGHRCAEGGHEEGLRDDLPNRARVQGALSR